MALSAGTLTLLLADCSAPRTAGKHASELKYGVASSPRVIPEGEPIPKGGGRDMVGKPYVVAGRTYIPHPGKGYDREGWASWYGSAFHGRLTANGEIFDRESVAAAHPTLPLPSYVRVTNLVNRRSMVVRVNDRGPYEYDRVIDLSERAADALGFHRKGTSRVRVQFIGRASLEGSDDARLMATLRTDGEMAPFAPPIAVASRERAVPASAPIKVAAAPEPSKPPSPPPGVLRMPAGSRTVSEPGKVRAAALAEPAGPASLAMPPRRPDLRSSN
jgi:rare lipoprotein A